MSSTTDETSFKTEKLNGDNFHSWKFNVKMYLIGRDLWDIVQGKEVLPDDPTEKQRNDFRKRDQQSWSAICLSIKEGLQIYVRNCNSGKEAWDTICSHFEEKTLSKKIFWRRKLYEMRLNKSSTMESHINELKTISEHLEALDDAVLEKDLVMILISSLSEDYNNLITTLETLKEEQLSWNYVRDRLLSEYQRKKEANPKKSSSDEALISRSDGGRNPNGGRNQQGKKGQQGGQGKADPNKLLKMQCHRCKEKGHLRRDCPKNLLAPESARFSSASLGIQHLEARFSREFALKVGGNGGSVGDVWWVDSGATSHMTPDLHDFISMSKFDVPIKVNLADKSYLLSYGHGDVLVPIYDVAGSESVKYDLRLQNTLYVPEIKNKLFSVPSALDNGGSVKFQSNSCILEMDDDSVEIAQKEGSLYRLKTEYEHSCCLGTVGKPLPLSTWHLRYGHLNIQDVKLLHEQKMVKGMSLSDSDSVDGCHGCALGKSKRNPFPKRSERKSTRPLELIHSDVCGPIHVESVGGSRYFITFVDDYSRFVTVYMLKTKDEALNKFMEFVAMAENGLGVKMQNFRLEGELGVSLKKFRSDGGGEYVSKRFLEFCKSRGIDKQLTMPYTPQQNGVAERMNRTLMEMARSMLYHTAKVSPSLWAEAVSTAAYLRNRCPTSSFPGATPYERWFGEKPDVGHLRVFGCEVYVHVPDEKRRKLDPKAVKGVFVGYPAGMKGYKVFLPESKSMICSRDVQFLEEGFGRVGESAADEFDISHFDVDRTKSVSFDDRVVNLEPLDDVESGDEIAGEDGIRFHIERAQRNRREPDRYGEWATVADASTNDPKTFKQAMKSAKSVHWKEAMQKEYESLSDHQTWDLVDLPKNANLVGCKWVFKTKRTATGEIDRYKARLVAQGFSQEAGVDYDEVYAPVAKYKSIRTMLAIGNQLDLEIHQMDVVAAFLNGDLDEDIYMKQPEGFVDQNNPNKVCKLKKSLYGLKQSARCWNEKIDSYMKSQGYKQSTADSCIYYRSEVIDGKHVIVIVGVYVDDTILMSNSTEVLNAEKKRISSRFAMEDRGEIHYLLGMEVKRDRKNRVLTISQKSYLESVVARFGMQDCKPISTPLETGKKFDARSEDDEPADLKLYQAAIGSLNYAAVVSRPDLSVAVGMLSQHMVSPSAEHWSGVKRVLRYVKGTLDYGLRFTATAQTSDFVLYGYSDADWAGCIETRKSTSGQVFRFGECTISWRSRKQSIVALSTTEAEYVSLCESAQEAVWLRRLLNDIGFVQGCPTVIYEDNQGAMALSSNPKDHSRTKHIDIKYHYIRQTINEKHVIVQYCETGDMTADTLTKGLAKPGFEKFRSAMGVYQC